MAKESLELNAEQRQTLTTSALKVLYSSLLEMSSQEVEERVKSEIEENPALEKAPDNDDDYHSDSDPGDGNAPSSDADDGDEKTNESLESPNSEEVPDYDDYSDRDDTYDDSYIPRANNRSADDNAFVPVVADSDYSLAEYLEEQLGEYSLTDRQREIALTVIGNIDDAGYLSRSLSAMANDLAINNDLDVETSEVKEVFDIVRQMDPAGVCAVGLGDCLTLQLRRIEPATADVTDAIAILSQCDDLSSVSKMNAARMRLGMSKSRYEAAMRRIRSLNPKPGNLIGSSAVASASQMITPDFDISVDENDTITVTILNNIPELQISESFTDEAEHTFFTGNTPQQREARKFISANRNNANMFIRVLRMRQSTLFSVMSAIVKIQRKFFLSGDQRDIKPMIIRDVCDITGFDLTVVSRATNGKYAQTPYGIFPLKFFFNEPINDSEGASSREIASIIKEIIDSEDPEHPYSDQKITEELARRGHNVARRTVFKYRENQLKIPSSSMRRRQKLGK
ncbi:MAG: RNA polymerase factor sigma-54 [Muribaculaceae bacterium]|nr:RNA polymerase factor sigma-54 [Muribaculaceae bacterium]